jgi:hypothetical protein
VPTSPSTNYRKSADLAAQLTETVRGMGRRALIFQTDVSSFADAQAMVQQVLDEFGRLDILVNNAGMNWDGVVWKMSEEQWDRVIDVDLKGTFNYTRAVTPIFRQRGAGKIVNITSINGLRGKFGQTNYSRAAQDTARRLGAADVQLVCLEARDEMPAYEREIALALEEGVVLHPSWGPKQILGDGRVTGIELVRCTSVFDAAGRFSPTFDESVTTALEADTVILAVGQAADLGFLNGARLGADPETVATALPGVFAAGDMALRLAQDVAGGDMSVVHAIASGRRAAEAVDRYLGNDGVVVAPTLIRRRPGCPSTPSTWRRYPQSRGSTNY